ALMPSMNTTRAMANLVNAAALADHQRGDDHAALAHLTQGEFIAYVADGYPSLVGHLVGVGCRALCADRIIKISSDLRIGSAPTDATPDDMRNIIALLLDDSRPRNGYIRGFQGERMISLQLIRGI